MKNLLLLALFTISTISATAQLSSTSQFVRKNLDEQYLQIRTKAVSEWSGDNTMIIYFINEQCESLIKYNDHPYSKMIRAKEGTEYKNKFLEFMTKWTELNADGTAFVDHKMVIYEIDEYIKDLKNTDY